LDVTETVGKESENEIVPAKIARSTFDQQFDVLVSRVEEIDDLVFFIGFATTFAWIFVSIVCDFISTFFASDSFCLTGRRFGSFGSGSSRSSRLWSWFRTTAAEKRSTEAENKAELNRANCHW